MYWKQDVNGKSIPQTPNAPKNWGPFNVCCTYSQFALGFCLTLPIKIEGVSMQDLGIKSLLHLGPSGGDSCAWTSKAMLQNCFHRKKRFQIVEWKFQFELSFDYQNPYKWVRKNVCLRNSKKTMGWVWDGTKILTQAWGRT